MLRMVWEPAIGLLELTAVAAVVEGVIFILVMILLNSGEDSQIWWPGKQN